MNTAYSYDPRMGISDSDSESMSIVLEELKKREHTDPVMIELTRPWPNESQYETPKVSKLTGPNHKKDTFLTTIKALDDTRTICTADMISTYHFDHTVTISEDRMSDLEKELECEANLNSELAKKNDYLQETIAMLENQLLQHKEELSDLRKRLAAAREVVDNEVRQEIDKKYREYYRRKIKQARKDKNAIIDSNRKLIKTLEKQNEESSVRLQAADDKNTKLEQDLQRSESKLKASEEKQQQEPCCNIL